MAEDPKAFVLLRYPGAAVWWSYDTCAVFSEGCQANRKKLSGRCKSEAAAWQSAAKRLGWRAER